ncbi:hypothetical protein [Streptomyces sp. NBC_00620]|uniref:hypothetical protein n=1 Tax=Streptomyces sp. NBC_00620 TaxID=2903666 RepID=UPI00225C12E6|nr:hypothetical protein [Streptomyces sp. NBC_00620]MCX4975723.1 hypothetical protein [Streptomyces sp. NBC_00620]
MMRVIVPYLRGHGPTRSRDPATPQSGQQRRVPHAGHILPQENPAAFTAAVLDLATPARPARHQFHRPS